MQDHLRHSMDQKNQIQLTQPRSTQSLQLPLLIIIFMQCMCLYPCTNYQLKTYQKIDTTYTGSTASKHVVRIHGILFLGIGHYFSEFICEVRVSMTYKETGYDRTKARRGAIAIIFGQIV